MELGSCTLLGGRDLEEGGLFFPSGGAWQPCPGSEMGGTSSASRATDGKCHLGTKPAGQSSLPQTTSFREKFPKIFATSPLAGTRAVGGSMIHGPVGLKRRVQPRAGGWPGGPLRIT